MSVLKILIDETVVMEAVVDEAFSQVFNISGASSVGVSVEVDEVSAVTNAAIVIQGSDDPEAVGVDPDSARWSNLVTPVTITEDGVVYLEKVDPECHYIRLHAYLDSGEMDISNFVLVKGQAV